MQDRWKHRQDGDALDRAADRAIAHLLARVPSEQHVEALQSMRQTMGEVLIRAPLREGSAVADMAVRARLAAAFQAEFLEDDGRSCLR